jgi:hypothetical protein
MSALDLSEVKHIERVIIGNNNPEKVKTEDEIKKDMERLNKLLQGHPKGFIIGTEKNFQILRIGEHQVIMQWIVYHIGFKRTPYSL